jgi:predicted  nucleic acid-binding Zn-ribbon protein
MTESVTAAELESLPFDQYQRYRLVSDLLGELRGQEPLRILDVGGRTALLRSFLPEDRVELVDVDPSDARGLVLGDGAALPFQDGAFDAVCAFDTLEHVPPPARAGFVGECARVARGWVILAGPYAHPRVDEAEERLVDFLEHKLKTRHRYLAEHRSNGLPDRRATQDGLEAAGARVASFGHGDLSRWLALMCLELYLDADPMLRPVAARFFRFYNRVLFDSDHGPEVYRHAVVAAFGDARLPVGARLDSPAQAPPGSTEAITELAAELLAFDRDRDALGPELARLKGVIAGFEQDLEGHRSRLADRTRDLEQHGATLEELRRTYEDSLAAHAKEKAALQADLEAHGRTIEEARAAHAEALEDAAELRAGYERDLTEHRAALQTLEADLGAHRAGLAEVTAEVEQLRGHQRDLEQQLSETQAGAQAIQAELLGARGDIESLVGELAAREQRIATLQADLRDRWGNLKRALGKKVDFGG